MWKKAILSECLHSDRVQMTEPIVIPDVVGMEAASEKIELFGIEYPPTRWLHPLSFPIIKKYQIKMLIKETEADIIYEYCDTKIKMWVDAIKQFMALYKMMDFIHLSMAGLSIGIVADQYNDVLISLLADEVRMLLFLENEETKQYQELGLKTGVSIVVTGALDTILNNADIIIASDGYEKILRKGTRKKILSQSSQIILSPVQIQDLNFDINWIMRENDKMVYLLYQQYSEMTSNQMIQIFPYLYFVDEKHKIIYPQTLIKELTYLTSKLL